MLNPLRSALYHVTYYASAAYRNVARVFLRYFRFFSGDRHQTDVLRIKLKFIDSVVARRLCCCVLSIPTTPLSFDSELINKSPSPSLARVLPTITTLPRHPIAIIINFMPTSA